MSPVAPEPHERAGEQQVPDQLIQESWAGRSCTGCSRADGARGDLETPRQRRRPAEQLLVEVVADPPDRLRDEQRRRGGVHEQRDVRAVAAQPPDADEGAGGDPAPDTKAPLPDCEGPPPVRRDFAPAGGQEVQAPADHARGEAPQRDLVDELAAAAPGLPAARGDLHRGDHRDHVPEAVGVEEQRSQMESVVSGAGDECERHADHGRRPLGARLSGQSWFI